MVQIGANAMNDESDEFRPRLGRMRTIGGRASKRYVARLYATVEKMKPGAFAKQSGGRFTGARLGRGAGAGAAAAMRSHPFAKFRSRRVAVKIRSVRLGGAGLAKARAHLNYIQRDSAARGQGRGELYGPEGSAVDGARFLEEGSSDRHQFRIILSPEDGDALEDLTRFTRDLVAAASRDLETRLDWVAVNHFHTDHPHVHIVLRGRSEDGGDLVIARSYITHGFRRRAEELATLELGPRRDLDIACSRAADVSREAFTTLDRDLLRRAAAGPIRFDAPETPYDRFQAKLLKDRLQSLQAMALAERQPEGWRLAPDLERRLREAGRRGDIIRSMGAELGADLAPHRLLDFAEEKAATRIVGRVAGIGAADDAHERRFLALEGADGAQWHAPIDGAPGAAPSIGAIVEVTRAGAAPRAADRTIAAIAERHGGVYADALHAAADPSATAEFRHAHKRRLEALRRVGLVERNAEGAWRIPEDFLERAAAHEGERASARVRVLSWAALDQLPGAGAVTFLDDALEKRLAIERVPHGFGAELDHAFAARRRWLLSQGIGREGEDGFAIDRDRLRARARTALEETATGLSRELGKSHAPPLVGDRVAGVYRRPVDLPAGRFALIERSKEFTLVPWREVLEQRRGLELTGLVRNTGINWEIGRTRGMGR
jgi:type IV secretory pathway VirD2 relaxase